MPAGKSKTRASKSSSNKSQTALSSSSTSTLLAFFLLPVSVVLCGCTYAWLKLQVDNGRRMDSPIDREKQNAARNKQSFDGVRIEEPRKSWNSRDMESNIGKQRCDLAVLDMKKGYSIEAFQKATSLHAFYPVLIRNAMNNWPAMSSLWNYDNFLRHYGEKTVVVAADIDHAYDLHKSSGEKVSLASLLTQWRSAEQDGGSGEGSDVHVHVHDNGFLNAVQYGQSNLEPLNHFEVDCNGCPRVSLSDESNMVD